VSVTLDQPPLKVIWADREASVDSRDWLPTAGHNPLKIKSLHTVQSRYIIHILPSYKCGAAPCDTVHVSPRCVPPDLLNAGDDEAVYINNNKNATLIQDAHRNSIPPWPTVSFIESHHSSTVSSTDADTVFERGGDTASDNMGIMCLDCTVQYVQCVGTSLL
jgi:hypothetical protein